MIDMMFPFCGLSASKATAAHSWLGGLQLSRANGSAHAKLFSIAMLPVSAIGLRMVAAANLVEVAALVGDPARATMGNGEPVAPIFIGRGAGLSPRARPRTRRVDDSESYG